jgi:ketosteroid isomerase-like protein
MEMWGRTLNRLLWLLIFWCSFEALAKEPGEWLFDSLANVPGAAKSEGQQVNEVLLKMLDRWNAHDVEVYMDVYWKSPQLLVVLDSAQFDGWQQLHGYYLNGYPDRDSMGYISPARIQITLLKPDLALALAWWSISFPNSRSKVVGNSTINLQKFDSGWKIVAAHSSTTDL